MNRLRLIRYELGLSQTEVARATGLSREGLSLIERREDLSTLHAGSAKKLADYYQMTVAELLGLSPGPQEPREAA